MIAVIFEVHINKGKQKESLQIAAELREHLVHFDGFVSIERFASLADENKLCSLSFWKDEASIAKWREFELLRLAQAKGKAEIFADFRIGTATVIRDYGMNDRHQTS